MNNPAQQVKRYTEVDGVKCGKTCGRLMLVLGSILLGAAIITASIILSKHTPNTAPTTQTVSDAGFSAYLAAKKFLPAWSHTNLSQINGQPAYAELLKNGTHTDLLKAFATRHNYSEIGVFVGSVQWNVEQWRAGVLPFAADVERFVKRIGSGFKYVAMIYVNDLNSNMSSFDQVAQAAKAITQYNAYQQEQFKFKSVMLQIEPGDEAACLKALETTKILNVLLDNVWITVGEICSGITLNESIAVYPNYNISQQIMSSNTTSISFQSALRLITNQAILFPNSTEVDTVLYFENKMKQISIHRLMFRADQQIGSYSDVISNFQELIINSDGESFAPKSYAELYFGLYGMWPRDSNQQWLINLYKG